MDRSIYVAMSGAKQILQAQVTNSNNLANVNTTGFRADLEQFRSMPVFGQGYPSRVYAMSERPSVDFTPGTIQTTGRELDVAIHGDGWISVQAKDGREAYTRAGDLRVSAEGLLQTGTGLPLIGNKGFITLPPAQKIEIGVDGTISIIPPGTNVAALAIIDQIKLVKPSIEQLDKDNDGLMHAREGGKLAPSADVQLVAGALETSNADSVGAMVHMMELARQFELQMKMMKTVNDNEAASAQIMRVG